MSTTEKVLALAAAWHVVMLTASAVADWRDRRHASDPSSDNL